MKLHIYKHKVEAVLGVTLPIVYKIPDPGRIILIKTTLKSLIRTARKEWNATQSKSK